MRDELLELVNKLKQSNSPTVAREYMIDELLKIVLESYK